MKPFRAALAVASLLLTPPVLAQTAKKAAPPAAEQPPIYDTDAIGEKQIAFYQKLASDSGRRMVLNLGTNDCAACRVYNRAIHEEKFFKVFFEQFVPADVDVSNLPNAELIEHYLVNPKAELPAVLIFMPDGRLIEALAHGEMAAIAKKGDGAVRDWFLARFEKN